MKSVFADTGFWVALLNPKDRWHAQALSLYQSLELQQVRVLTSEMVLTELLNFFSKFQSTLRKEVALRVIQMEQHPNITVIPQNTQQFKRALEFYLKREDKEWSLTDCSSFLIMQDLNVKVALAHDRHFRQAGFQNLLTER
jgi:predicted nucleic acid-binding protein